MPRICYVEKNFSGTSRYIIGHAQQMCANYAAQGLNLTLRQAYYQYVGRDLFPDDWTWSRVPGTNKWVKDPGGTKNAEPNYKRLGSIINDARLAGLLDWDYIVDRTREPDGPGTKRSPHWNDPKQIIEAVEPSYQLDKWSDQEHYVEAWVEKEAMAGILESACPDLDVKFFCCRGYSSQSAMWQAANRIGTKIEEGKKARVIYLGDHDPSGIDMTRDVWDRLATFIAQDQLGSPSAPAQELESYIALYHEDLGNSLEVDRVALNMDQIRHYDPPPNPAKLSDSRAVDYVRKFGDESWELDALEPSVLVDIVRKAVAKYRIDDLYEGRAEQENHDKVVLAAVRDRWEEVEKFLTESEEK